LRRVATLVARAVPAERVFTAVAEEVGRVIPGADYAMVARYGSGGEEPAGDGSPGGRAGRGYDVVGGWSGTEVPVPVGNGALLGGSSTIAGRVLDMGRPVRTDSYAGVPGWMVPRARGLGVGSAAGAPISVDGRVWGLVLVASTGPEPLPPDTEARLAEFTDLVATAIANTQARVELHALVDEQAALRRVATLVARGEPPRAVFAAVAEEVGRLLPADLSMIGRYEGDATVTAMAAWGGGANPVPVGDRFPVGGRNAVTMVRETGRPARMDGYRDASGAPAEAARAWGIGSTVGAPISVAGRVWGVMVVAATGGEPLPVGTEARLAGFTELVATAIANADAREELSALAAEQAALRRVATLVARSVPPSAVFEAVTREVGLLCGADLARMERYERDGTVTGVAVWSRVPDQLAVGTQFSLDGPSVARDVRETGGPVRIESFVGARGAIPQEAHRLGIRSSIGCPIVAAGRLWGVIAASTTSEEPFPANTESQIASFTELVATAIENAESQAQLAASRARVVAAADEMRRRLERDLHDGAQQRLVSLALELRLVQDMVPAELPGLRAGIGQVADELTEVMDELREISRGIHPAILSEGGLGPALRTLTRRSTVPVELHVDTASRYPPPVEVAAYYVVSEALTNMTKHADASQAEVLVEQRDSTLRLRVRDDGIGGAEPQRGSGLIGLRDRVEALGGSIEVTSPVGHGTVIQVSLPTERTDGGRPAGSH
jgi:signal transduction histidine kinase